MFSIAYSVVKTFKLSVATYTFSFTGKVVDTFTFSCLSLHVFNNIYFCRTSTTEIFILVAFTTFSERRTTSRCESFFYMFRIRIFYSLYILLERHPIKPLNKGFFCKKSIFFQNKHTFLESMFHKACITGTRLRQRTPILSEIFQSFQK